MRAIRQRVCSELGQCVRHQLPWKKPESNIDHRKSRNAIGFSSRSSHRLSGLIEAFPQSLQAMPSGSCYECGCAVRCVTQCDACRHFNKECYTEALTSIFDFQVEVLRPLVHTRDDSVLCADKGLDCGATSWTGGYLIKTTFHIVQNRCLKNINLILRCPCMFSEHEHLLFHATMQRRT